MVTAEPAPRDSGYGSAEMLGWLVYEHGIEPHVTVFDKSARTWYSKAECLGSLEVDDELKRYWLLHRQIAWTLTLQDAINVLGCRPKHPRKVNPIRREPPSGAKRGKRIDRGEPVSARQFDKGLLFCRVKGSGGKISPEVPSLPKFFIAASISSSE